MIKRRDSAETVMKQASCAPFILKMAKEDLIGVQAAVDNILT
jgi:hypothetical protein